MKKMPVQPLIGEDIQRAKDYLLNKSGKASVNLRNYTLFTFNINIGLHVSDLLALKISDVVIDNTIVDVLMVKGQEIPIRIELMELLYNYINSLGNWEYDWYLFHGVCPHRTPYKQMNRRTISFIMEDIKNALGLEVPLSALSMRKTLINHTQIVPQKTYCTKDMIAKPTREHEMSLYLEGELI